MGEIGTDSARRPTLRRITGWAAGLLALLMLALFVLGTWNPGKLIVLWRFAGNPFLGAIIVFALALLSSWLLAPVANEAVQVGRTRWRIAFGLGLLVSLLAYGLFGPRFATDYTVLAAAEDRRIVLYNPGTDFQRLHVWAGAGLGATYVGDLGKPCGATTVTFVGADTIRVYTSYVDVQLRLDPRTGRPLDRLGPTCAG
jgi:hypothetical protein